MADEKTAEGIAQEREALMRALGMALAQDMQPEAEALTARIQQLEQTGSSQPTNRVTSFGGLKETAQGVGRGVRNTLGLGGTLQQALGKPEGAADLPGPEDINAGLETIGVDPAILEGGENSFMGRTGEFFGAGGPFAAPSMVRAGVTSGAKGIAKQLLKYGGGTLAASTGSEVVGNMFEEFGLPRAYGNVTGAMMPWASMKMLGRMATSQSAKARAAGLEIQQEAIKRADDYMIAISHGTANPNTRVKFFERLLSSMPGGIRTMHDHALQVVNQVGQAVRRVSKPIKGADINPETAGIGISAGLNRRVQNLQKTSRLKYKNVDRLVDPNTPIVLRSYSKTVRELAEDSPDAVKGVVDIIRSGRDQLSPQLKSALDKITGGNPNVFPKLTFQEANHLRRAVGAELGNSSTLTNPYFGELKRLYGSLSDDVGNGLQGPARQAWDDASSHWKAARSEIDDFIDPVFGKGGKTSKKYEDIYRNAFGTDGRKISTVRTVWNTLSPTEKDLVAKTMITRMGRVPAGQEVGKFSVNPDFSMQQWLRQWRNKNFQPAKEVIFKDLPKYKKDLDELALYMDEFINTNSHLANPSGSGMVGLAAASSFFAMSAIAGGAAGYTLGDEDGGEKVKAALGAAVGLYGASRGVKLTAHLMTSPKFVNWMAAGTKVPASQTAQHFSRLAVIAERNPDLAPDIAAFMDEVALSTSPEWDASPQSLFPNLPGTL